MAAHSFHLSTRERDRYISESSRLAWPIKEFQAIQGYIVRPYLKTLTTAMRHTMEHGEHSSHRRSSQFSSVEDMVTQ